MTQKTLNSAGGSAADPILKNLLMEWVVFSTSMDVAAVNDSFIDTVTGFPGTNSTSGSLSPAKTVTTGGSSGAYNNTSKEYTIGSNTGLTIGDYLYLSHPLITDGIYPIASKVGADKVTITGSPLNGQANQTNVAYQVAWKWKGPAGSVGAGSDAAGKTNYGKFDAQDGATAKTQLEDTTVVRDAPVGAAFVEVAGGDYTGQTVNTFVLTLKILKDWANNGGVTHVEMANHSGQGVNNFTWTAGGGTGEKTLAQAEGGLTVAAGDGAKYGRLLLKGKAGGSSPVGVDLAITIDSSGPVLVSMLMAA